MKPSFHRHRPVVLSIAGSDSSGGAGIQADLKTFSALGVYGTTVITCVTAQSPKRILGIEPCPPKMVARQLEAVFEGYSPQAVKTGMLFSAKIIDQVARFFTHLEKKPVLIVDPVMISSSGARLLEPAGLKTLETKLLPLADLVTPNLAEAKALTEMPVGGPEEMRAAAKRIKQKFGCAVLVKGGHLQGFREALDIFYDGQTELLLSAPRVRQGHTLRGTGCTYSAAMAAYCALGCTLPAAVQKAKAYVTRAIAQSISVSGIRVLNHRAGP